MLVGLAIFLGGGLGSVARWWVSIFVGERFGQAFPWGTILVNISGCFIIGLFASLTGSEGRWLAPGTVRQFFMIGICGGYTTFSSFSLQSLALARDGRWLASGMNVLLSVVLCLIAVWLGDLVGTALNPAKGS